MTDSISRLCQAVPRISLTFGVEQADVRRLDRFHANQTMSVPSSKWERHTSQPQHRKTAKQRRGADRHMGFRRQMLCGRPQCRERFAMFCQRACWDVDPLGFAMLCQIATIQSPTSPSKNSLWRSRHVASKTKDKRGGRTSAKNTSALGFELGYPMLD